MSQKPKLPVVAYHQTQTEVTAVRHLECLGQAAPREAKAKGMLGCAAVSSGALDVWLKRYGQLSTYNEIHQYPMSTGAMFNQNSERLTSLYYPPLLTESLDLSSRR